MKKWQRLCKQSNKFGKSWYTGLEAGGKPIYTYTKGGVVKGAGYMNMTVEEMIIKYGLNDRYEIDKLWKNNDKGIITSNEMITEKEGYEAMLYMLKAYLEATGSPI